MPIEIRELIIKATVSDDPNKSGTNSGLSASDNGGDAKETEINLIVEKVLEVMKQKAER